MKKQENNTISIQEYINENLIEKANFSKSGLNTVKSSNGMIASESISYLNQN
jgi:hypothetical protein